MSRLWIFLTKLSQLHTSIEIYQLKLSSLQSILSLNKMLIYDVNFSWVSKQPKLIMVSNWASKRHRTKCSACLLPLLINHAHHYMWGCGWACKAVSIMARQNLHLPIYISALVIAVFAIAQNVRNVLTVSLILFTNKGKISLKGHRKKLESIK